MIQRFTQVLFPRTGALFSSRERKINLVDGRLTHSFNYAITVIM